MLCSSGGEICAAAKPAGPRTVSHSVAMSVHFQSKRWTNTSPAAMWPLGRDVWGRTGRPGGTETTGGGGHGAPGAPGGAETTGDVNDEPHAAANATRPTPTAQRAEDISLMRRLRMNSSSAA